MDYDRQPYVQQLYSVYQNENGDSVFKFDYRKQGDNTIAWSCGKFKYLPQLKYLQFFLETRSINQRNWILRVTSVADDCLHHNVQN